MAMSMVNASITYKPSNSNNASHFLVPFFPFPIYSSSVSSGVSREAKTTRLHPRGRKGISVVLTVEREHHVDLRSEDDVEDEEGKEGKETLLYSFNPLALVLLGALPGVRVLAGAVRSLFGPIIELIKTWSLPDWLVHWGHPGNMAVVLFAMGGYGTYLGFQIRSSDSVEAKAKAKDLHPKLMAGMFFFFALGATGGVTSLLTSDRPIFESPHAITGIIGLSLLTIQTILPSLFEGNPGLRNVHGILGSGIMTLFLVHAALGLQLGLSY